MSLESDNDANTATAAPKKKVKREPTSMHIDPGLLQEARIMAVLKNKSITHYFEEALRAKLDVDYKGGKYMVGHGGMYIPPPPSSSPSPSKPEQLKQSKIFDKDTIKSLAEGEGEIHLWLPSLKFPTNKEKLMQIAKLYDAKLKDYQDSMSHIIVKLPDTRKTYKDESQLEEEIVKICNTDKELIEESKDFEIQKIVGCIIHKEEKISKS